MTLLRRFFLFMILCVILTSCDKEEPSYMLDFNAISQTEYNSSDVFEDDQVEINDTWRALRIDIGGVVGTTPLFPDFEFLLIKPNGIFGIVRNDSLITTGEIVNVENQDDLFQIRFEPEVNPEELGIQMLMFNQITVRIDDGTMRLIHSTSATVLTKEF